MGTHAGDSCEPAPGEQSLFSGEGLPAVQTGILLTVSQKLQGAPVDAPGPFRGYFTHKKDRLQPEMYRNRHMSNNIHLQLRSPPCRSMESLNYRPPHFGGHVVLAQVSHCVLERPRSELTGSRTEVVQSSSEPEGFGHKPAPNHPSGDPKYHLMRP